MNRYLIRLIMLSFAFALTACGSNESGNGRKGKITIFHAGSLSVPLKMIAEDYERLHPGIEILMEGAGSVDCARKIVDLKKPCDIIASADYQIIDEMLIPGFASWNIQFASNSMVIIYTDKSHRSSEINSENWIDILLDENVFYGRSDPDSDPCGYRTLLTLQLAEKYYGRPGIAAQISGKDMNMIRPKEVDLLALLETNAIDYVFIYKSVAIQHNLRYLELPAEIDLSTPQLDNYYSTVSVDIAGSKPGETITINGANMVYGVSLLDNAPDRENAIDFLAYMLGDPGMKIINDMGQRLKSPPITRHLEDLPLEIRSLCIENDF